MSDTEVIQYEVPAGSPGTLEMVQSPGWQRFADDLIRLGRLLDAQIRFLVLPDHPQFECPSHAESEVYGQVQAAREGFYGPDVQAYWKAAKGPGED